ncbi:hypothetical protein Tco_0690059 [Tanacetum coccineum]
MVISSPCLTDIKNWLVQKQTASGKDFSNPFMADSLPKTIWFSTHHASHASCYCNEALAIPEQTATGKEISNPFMAGDPGYGVLALPVMDAFVKLGHGYAIYTQDYEGRKGLKASKKSIKYLNGRQRKNLEKEFTKN